MSINSVFKGRIKTIHMIGIGGIGMSGIAHILLASGFDVSGSDLSENQQTKSLVNLGAKIFKGHRAAQVGKCDLVVYSSAISMTNVEMIHARKRNLPIIPRALMLAELMRLHCGIAVAGSHGKTTTTSIIGTLMDKVGLDPSVIIGGVVNHFGSNGVLGKSQYMVTEADESDGTFLQLSPSIAVVTNIDDEHLDVYPGGSSELCEKFLQFLNSLPFYGSAVICIDDIKLKKLASKVERRLVTYGFDEGAHYRAYNIKTSGFSTTFDLKIRDNRKYNCHINMAGHHNVLNTLASIAVLEELGIDCETFLSFLSEFSGVKRRFSSLTNSKNFFVIDDYAHHPTEISAVLKAARSSFADRKIRVLFQPHRYSRTRDLMQEFSSCFKDCDSLVITDIYPAAEKPIAGITTKNLIKNIKRVLNIQAEYAKNIHEGALKICDLTKINDVVLTLGAGSITNAGPNIVNNLNIKYGDH